MSLPSISSVYKYSDSMHKQPCRFFLDRAAYAEEVVLYKDSLLRHILPELLHANDNANGAVCSRSGFTLPAYLVLERGVTLKAWHAHQRSYFEVAAMFESVLWLLKTLHAEGYVHRDLKPENILCLLSSSQWRLLDLGIVAREGALLIVLLLPRRAYPRVVVVARTDALLVVVAITPSTLTITYKASLS